MSRGKMVLTAFLLICEKRRGAEDAFVIPEGLEKFIKWCVKDAINLSSRSGGSLAPGRSRENPSESGGLSGG